MQVRHVVDLINDKTDGFFDWLLPHASLHVSEAYVGYACVHAHVCVHVRVHLHVAEAFLSACSPLGLGTPPVSTLSTYHVALISLTLKVRGEQGQQRPLGAPE